MITDRIENAGRYASLHPLFGKALEFLSGAESLSAGRYELDGDSLFVIVSDNSLRPSGDMEAHRKYIDIQLVLEGAEKFRCAPAALCTNVSKPYDADADIMFFSDAPTMEYSAGKGTFSVFFPEDAHAPLIGDGSVRKAIAKVKLI